MTDGVFNDATLTKFGNVYATGVATNCIMIDSSGQ